MINQNEPMRIALAQLNYHIGDFENNIAHIKSCIQRAKSLPADLSRCEVVLIDPMLATGGSASAAMDLLTELGAKHVRMVNVVAAPEGIRQVRARYPELLIFTAAIDRKLNEKGYILPGLGDAGDRISRGRATDPGRTCRATQRGGVGHAFGRARPATPSPVAG